MADAKVDFEVKPGPGILGYWITAGGKDVTLTNGKGSVLLPKGSRPYLVWWFSGSPGKKIGITGKQGSATVVEVTESKIPKNETQGAGAKRFTVL